MTANEFWKEQYEKYGISLCNEIHVEILMIEFAKYHVEQALLKAKGEAPIHCSEGIENCYPLENIK